MRQRRGAMITSAEHQCERRETGLEACLVDCGAGSVSVVAGRCGLEVDDV